MAIVHSAGAYSMLFAVFSNFLFKKIRAGTEHNTKTLPKTAKAAVTYPAKTLAAMVIASVINKIKIHSSAGLFGLSNDE